MAQHLIRAFADHGLEVHDNKPVRDRVVRQRSEFVPAVLRFNAVPAKVLVEVCNLGNPQDRALIQTQDFRERVARAIVDGISSYYGYQPSRSAGRVAGR
jgi:N-acetylmuramoyl-L-alanine amidase